MPKILTFLLLISSFACADKIDTYKEGQILYSSKGCNGCHGMHGEGMNTYPILMNKQKYLLLKK